MLPWCKGAEVHSGESTHGDGADTVEESIYIADVELAVTCVEDARGDKGGEGAVVGVGQPFNRSSEGNNAVDRRSQKEDVDPVEVEMRSDVPFEP